MRPRGEGYGIIFYVLVRRSSPMRRAMTALKVHFNSSKLSSWITNGEYDSRSESVRVTVISSSCTSPLNSLIWRATSRTEVVYVDMVWWGPFAS
jgi:hypothetical protein